MLFTDSMSSSKRDAATATTKAAAEHLLAIAEHVREEARAVSINKHQSMLAAERFWLMCYSLSQLPNPQPSMAQFAIAASATELIAEMSDEAGCAPLLLRQNFTCTTKFEAFATRLKSVWRLQSTAKWRAEDRAAAEKDEKTAAADLLRRFVPREPHSKEELSRALSDLFFPEQQQRHPITTDNTASELTQLTTEAEVLAWVRRRQLAPWRLPFETLHREPIIPHAARDLQFVSTRAIVRRSPSFSFQEGPTEDGEVHSRWYFGSCPVSLQILESGLGNTGAVCAELAEGTLTTEEVDVIRAAFADAQTQSLMDFVLDAAARTSWCHPHLLQYWGAFTETHPAMADDQDDRDEEGKDESEAAHDDVEDQNSTHRSRSSAGQPEISLGMVLTDPRHPPVLGEDPVPGAQVTTTSLKDVLFTSRRRLPVGECVQIVEQVADALHYVLLGDNADMPESVLRAWCTVSPAHLFLTECFVPTSAGEATESHRDETTARPMARDARQGSQIFVDSGDPGIEGTSTTGQESAADTQAPSLSLRSRLVRYAPPCAVTGLFALHSRWKPHPQAASAPCYALSQLLLALLTCCPPYRRLRTQAELRNRVFELPGEDPDLIAEGLPAVKTTRPRGYTLPDVLPDALKALCTTGLRLVSPREVAEMSHSYSITSGLQQLQQWREQLSKLHVAMSTEEWTAPLPLAQDRIHGAAAATAIPVAPDESADIPMKEQGGRHHAWTGATVEDDYAADWFEYGLPEQDTSGVYSPA